MNVFQVWRSFIFGTLTLLLLMMIVGIQAASATPAFPRNYTMDEDPTGRTESGPTLLLSWNFNSFHARTIGMVKIPITNTTISISHPLSPTFVVVVLLAVVV